MAGRRALGFAVLGLLAFAWYDVVRIQIKVVTELIRLANGTPWILRNLHGCYLAMMVVIGVLFFISAAAADVAVIRQIYGAVRLARWMAAHRRPATPEMLRAMRDADVRAPLYLVQSEGAFALTYGLLWPRIVVSEGLVRCTTHEELVAVLRHEQRHASGFHPLVKFITRIVCRAFFYVPHARRLIAQVTDRQELAADRAALEGASRSSLAGALYKVAAGPAFGATVASAQLTEARIVQMEQGPMPRLWGMQARQFWLSVILVVSLIGIGATLVLLGHLEAMCGNRPHGELAQLILPGR
ncbi:MAG: M56 family metallopeptidase [Actinomadura rubrobrunea]|nr:M56 family metallopeptidase [Actinomadura rubrobrunea]